MKEEPPAFDAGECQWGSYDAQTFLIRRVDAISDYVVKRQGLKPEIASPLVKTVGLAAR
jgi:hypothetical protein